MINQANKGDKKERERRSIHGELQCMYVCVRPLEAVAGNTESPILNVN